MYKNRSKGLILSSPAVSLSNPSKGFTLIELLVVIAIIGILSAVVLASLNTARSRGNDAAIQSNLATIRTQAELYYGGAGNNSYAADGNAGNTCAVDVFSDSVIAKSITATEITNGAGTGVICGSTPTAYAVSSALVAGVGGNMFWCVDSAGNARSHASAMTAGATVCP